MKHPLSLEAFADWCGRQGSRRYSYSDVSRCALTQYANWLGVECPYESQEGVAPVSKRGSFWYKADRLAYKKPWNFKALAARTRLAM